MINNDIKPRAFMPKSRAEYINGGSFLFKMAQNPAVAEANGLILDETPAGLRVVEWTRLKPHTRRRVTCHSELLYQFDKVAQPTPSRHVGSVTVYAFGWNGLHRLVERTDIPKPDLAKPDIIAELAQEQLAGFDPAVRYALPAGEVRDSFVADYLSFAALKPIINND